MGEREGFERSSSMTNVQQYKKDGDEFNLAVELQILHLCGTNNKESKGRTEKQTLTTTPS